MAGKAPEKQDHALFDLFGRKKEEKKEKRHDGQMMQAPVFHPHNQAQTAPYHHPAAAVQHGAATHNQAAEHGQVRPVRPPGYEGQYFTAGETERQLHTGLPGKFHNTDSPDSSSSSEEGEEDGQRKTGASKKKGGNDKLPGRHHSS